MHVFWVLLVSIIFQYLAAYFAFLIYLRRGRKAAWLAISLAVFLMGIRRSITLFRIITADLTTSPDLTAEIVALIISTLMAVGIISAGDFLHFIWASEKSLSNVAITYHGLFNNTSDAVILINLNKQIIEVNPKMVEMIGYSRKAILGKSVMKYVSDSDVEFVSEKFDLLNSGKKVPLYEHTFKRNDGTLFPVEVDMSLVVESSGNPLHIIGIVRDISGRKRSEDKYKQKTDELQTLTEYLDKILLNLPVGIAILEGPEFRYFRINNFLADLNGIPVEEHLGRTIAEVLPMATDDIVPTLQKVFNTQKPGNNRKFTTRLPNNPEEEVHLIDAHFPIIDPDGNSIAVGVVVIDDTDRKKAEEEISFQALLLSQIHNGVIAVDKNNKIKFWNNYAENLYQWTSEEAIGKDIVKLLSPENMKSLATSNLENIQSHGHWEGEFLVKRKDGSTIPALILNTILKDNNGNDIGILGISTDITERKIAEEKIMSLLQAEQEQRIIAETLTEASLAISSEKDIDSIMDEILTQSKRIVPFKSGNIMYIEGDEMVLAAWQGYEQIDIPELFKSTPFTDFPIEKNVLFTRTPIMVEDSSKNPDWVFIDKISWIKSFLCIPIILQEKTLGLLRLDSEVVSNFSSLDIARLQPLMNAAAVAIDNAQLVQKVIDENSERKISELRLSEAQEIAHIGHFEWLPEQDRAFWSSEVYRIFGVYRDNFQPGLVHLLELIHPADREVVKEVNLAGATHGTPWDFEYRIQLDDGEIRYVHSIGHPELDDHGNVIRIKGTVQDITERKQAEEEITFKANLLEGVTDAVFSTDENFNITSWNKAAQDIYYWKADEVLGKNVAKVINPVYPQIQEDIGKELFDIGFWDGEAVHQRKDGNKFSAHSSVSSIYNKSGLRIGFVSITQDITERKLAEEKLNHMATHDALTNLPNRLVLSEIITHGINIADRRNSQIAVLFMDLDGFKAVNDAYGHNQGDRVLRLLADRIKNSVRESDTLARIGGDEFGIILEGIDQTKDILPVVEKILATLAKTFSIQDSETFITGSIGISVFPSDGKDAETLLNNADRAMYQAKEGGKNSYQFYSSEMESQMLEALELRNQLRQAIKNQELVVYYQPQINLHSGEAVGVEALVRWQHPTKGLLLPATFIKHAEDTGLIIELGNWVTGTAIKQLISWKKLGHSPIRMSVNVSGKELIHSNYYDNLQNLLAEADIAPEQLELEITENTIFGEIEKTSLILDRIKSLGVRIAIDDFGSGYSTLFQLSKFPFDTLKVDRTFASHLDESANLAILKGIINIGNELGLQVIGEGVETRGQLETYKEFGCATVQGYIFSKPIPPEKFEPFLRDNSRFSPLLKTNSTAIRD